MGTTTETRRISPESQVTLLLQVNATEPKAAGLSIVLVVARRPTEITDHLASRRVGRSVWKSCKMPSYAGAPRTNLEMIFVMNQKVIKIKKEWTEFQ